LPLNTPNAIAGLRATDAAFARPEFPAKRAFPAAWPAQKRERIIYFAV